MTVAVAIIKRNNIVSVAVHFLAALVRNYNPSFCMSSLMTGGKIAGPIVHGRILAYYMHDVLCAHHYIRLDRYITLVHD